MIFALVLLASPVHTRIPCWIVKAYVATLGEAGAREKGHVHGYTDIEIDAVKRRCGLK